jgi:hypothetical protein
MLTKGRKLPKADISSHRPKSETPQAVLSHDYRDRSTDTSEMDFEVACEQSQMWASDRIRAVLGLRKEPSLPNVSAESMLLYYRHLMDRMTFPCEAIYSSDAAGTAYPVIVTGLVDPQTISFDNRVGLCCTAYCGDDVDDVDVVPLADIEIGEGCPNFHLFEDYWFWLWNWRESRSYRPSNPR